MLGSGQKEPIVKINIEIKIQNFTFILYTILKYHIPWYWSKLIWRSLKFVHTVIPWYHDPRVREGQQRGFKVFSGSDIDSYSLKENKALVCKMNRSKIVLKNWYHKIMTFADHFFFTVIIDYAHY